MKGRDVNPAESNPAVAIIGMGCLFPRAEDLSRYWANIRAGRDAIGEVPETHWRPEDYFSEDPKAPDRTYARRGGFLDPVDFPALEFGIAPNNIEATDTTQLLGLLAARRALDDAGYGPVGGRPFDRDRVGVILGVTGTLELVIPLGARLGHPIWRRALEASGITGPTADEVVRRIADSYVGWQENSFPGLLGNVAAGRIANRLDLGGTNCVIDAACASSLGALHLAMLELTSGRSDMVLTGGVDTFNDIFMYMCFSKTPALSPSGDARPFDAAGDGTILGEGLGVAVLKRLDDARRDGDRVYAVIRGVGTSSDGKGGAVYAPKAAGQVKAIRAAYAAAGVSPETIELVEAHGTGTKVGDATELEALEEVYRAAGAEGTWCALGSVKSQIGHTKAAAGAAGLIKAALALHHKVLPPTAKVTRPIEPLASGRSPFYLNTEPRPWLPRDGHPRRAAVSAFGFGGSNFHCVLEEAESAKTEIDWDGDVQIVGLSAPDRGALLEALGRWPADLGWAEFRAEAARSRDSFQADDPCRLLLVVERGTYDWAATARKARALLAEHGGPSPSPAADGVYLGEGPAAGRLAMLFPGQGSQYVGMLRDLACQFPPMQWALAEADGRLGDLIYPPALSTDADPGRHDQALKATQVAQPAIGAVSMGLLGILAHFGVRPDAVGGHSFGELSALCAAGRFDASALAVLARRRGELMAEGAGDRGAMLAVLAPLDRIEAILREERLDLVVANRNAPQQAVLSGPSAEIERAARAFEARRIAARPLAVSAAFHSRLVADARGPFLETLRSIPLAGSSVPVFANTTAAPYPADPDEARALLAGQLAEPVAFVEQVRAMADWGARTFLEVGPDAKLTGLVDAILEGSGHAAVAVDASKGRRGNVADLARALARLAALGHPVRLALWDDAAPAPAPAERRPGLTVKVCGANPAPRPQTVPAPETRPTPPMKPTTDSAPAHRKDTHSNGDASTHPGRNGSAPHAESAPRLTNGVHVSPAHARPAPASATAPAPVPVPAPAWPSGQVTPLPLHRADPTVLSEALRNTQANLVALQRLNEQTAQLHRQFLEGQEKSQRSFQSLLDQQQRLTLASLGLDVPAPPAAPARLDAPATRAHAFAPPASRLSPPVAPPAPPVSEKPAPSPSLAPRPAHAPAPAAAAPAPAPAIVPSPVPARPGPRILDVLVEVVSEKTGYPAEMLEPGMELDADLGIDSIKRVEILSALQERLPESPVIGPEHLGTLRTLRHIAEFLGEGGLASAAEAPAGGLGRATVEGVLLEVVSEKTGYPAEMLEPGMELDADLGIDSIKRVEILSALQERLPESPVIGPEHLGTLRTLRHIAEFLGQGGPASPVPPAAATPGGGLSRATVEGVLLEVVSEKTGYPAEMLEPGMELDADLGIDSIKRVEILSALQERLPESPVIGPEHLGTLRTLRHIAEFLAGGAVAPPAAGVAVAPSPSAATVHAPLEAHAAPEIERLIVASVPLEEPAAGEAVVPRPGSTFWIADDGTELPSAVAEHLAGRGYHARVIGPDAAASTPAPERLGGLVLLASGTDDSSGGGVKDAFRLLRAAAGPLRAAGRDGGAVLATVSRLDGAFGLHGLAATADPASGGLAGLAKTARHEWPEVHCKAIDLDPALPAGEAAERILGEMFRGGPAEVGLGHSGRTTLGLVPCTLNGDGRRPPLARGDVVVVTGGARGVTAEVAVALAQTFRSTVVLLGRSPEPEPEPDWLAGLTDEAAIKRALLAQAGGRLSPQALGERSRRVAAGREVRANLARIEAAGARVVYRSLDVRDAAAVRRCLEQLRAELGPIRGLVHGAGVLADRRIEDKTDEQFAHVYDTKVGGLRGLLEAVEGDELRLLLLFSSSTARFGRTGQVAYAAANEVLNKVAQREAKARPSCRVVSVNWGPWDGGMVNASLRGVFEAEGVALIDPKAGARYIVEEIQTVSDRPVEVVVLGAGSSAAVRGPSAPSVPPSASPPASLSTVFERAVDVDSTPVLRSHVIDGRPVVPMALILEWLAQGALHRNPGLVLLGVDDLRLLKGIVLRDGHPYTVRIMAGKAAREGDHFRVPVELRGAPKGGPEVPHARAEVLLADRYPEGRPSLDPAALGLRKYAPGKAEIYGEVLFHGPDMRGLGRVEGLGEGGCVAWAAPAPPPSDWMDRPFRKAWISDPLAIDAAFQMLILWCADRRGACSLPTRIGTYRQFRRSFPAGGVRIVAQTDPAHPHRTLSVVEFLDAEGGLVARMEGYECVLEASLSQAFRRNRLAPVASS